MITVTREMGMTHRDFFRTFPSVAGDRPVQIEGSVVRLETGQGEIVIRLGPEQVRKIALLTLPLVHLQFDFHGHDQDQAAVFMARFDLSFRRGGG